MRFAKRLDEVPPYLFAELERKIEEREKAGIDVISLGIGDPDLPTPEPVVEALARAARNPGTHQYPSNRGTDGVSRGRSGLPPRALRSRARPGHRGDPSARREGRRCPHRTGDARPGRHSARAGPGLSAVHVRTDLLREPTCTTCPSPRRTTSSPISRAAPEGRLLFLNYPNNPTGATAGVEFFERAVAFARKRSLIVVHDNAYSEITFDGYRAPSFLEAKGAREVGVEIFSLSKGWNMTGWRAGWIAGNPELVERYRHLKTNLDSGMFEAVQAAAVSALTEARDFPRQMSEVYQRRRDLVADALREIGLEITPPQATPYFWARVPSGYTSASFAELVLEEANVVVSPGNAYGPSGEGYVRLSLTVPDERLQEAVSRIKASLVILQP